MATLLRIDWGASSGDWVFAFAVVVPTLLVCSFVARELAIARGWRQ